MRLSLLAIIPWASLVAATPVRRQSDTSANSTSGNGILKPETYATIQLLFNASQIPGGVLAISSPDGDEVIPLGVKSNTQEPVNKDTYWAIASNTKLITAMTVNLLVEQNLTLGNGEPFTLDSKLVDFVPDFQLWNASASGEVSVADVLTHYTGIPGTNTAVNTSWTASDWVANLRYLRTNIPPHTIFQYSNINFVIATRVVEVVTGRSFYDVSKELIFDPLGLDAVWDPRQAEDKSQGFLRTGINYTACVIDSAIAAGDLTSLTSVEIPASCLGTAEAIDFWTEGSGQEWAGGGAAVLTGNDMLKWMKSLLNPEILPAEVVDRVQTPVYFLNEAKTSGIAHGNIFTQYRGFNLSLHDGALPGSNSLFVRAPTEKVGFFVAVNDDTYGITFNQQIQALIMDDLLGLDPIAVNGTQSGGASESSPDAAANSGTVDGAGYTSAAGIPTAPIPDDARDAPDLSGTYASPGFSDFTLTPLNLSDEAEIEAAGFPLDFLLTDASTVLGIDYLSTPIWHATWGQMFVNHLFFTAFDGPLINYTGMLVYDRVPGEIEIQQVPVNGSQYVGKLTTFGPAVWSPDEGGIGFFGNFWTQSTALPFPEVVEQNVNATAEAFFTKR